jgi:hypothetical protein
MKFLDVPKSGSYQSNTYSRSRFGQYVRSRATPVNPNSTAQASVRSRQSANAAAWRALTDNQRAGWMSLGQMIIRTDSLGQPYNLTGFQAFVSVNNNRLLVGDDMLEDSPAIETPESIESLTPTITPTSFSLAFTPSPLGQAERIIIYASPQRSAGRNFEHDTRFLKASQAAGASPITILPEYSAKFGAPQVGSKIFVSVCRYSNGFLSIPLTVSKVVTAS